MSITLPPVWSLTRFRVHIHGLVLLALLTSLLGIAPTARSVEAGPRVQPSLLQAALSHPDTSYQVIVQKSSKGADVESMVRGLGGKITKDLSIINGFAASLPGKAVGALAKDSNVRWISADGPVQFSSGPAVFTTWATDNGLPTAVSTSGSFNSTAIAAGKYIWFSSTLQVSGTITRAATINLDGSQITTTAGGSTISLDVPAATVRVDPAATTATTQYDASAGAWTTTVPNAIRSHIFTTGMVFQVPVNVPGGINPVTWSARFRSDTPGLTLEWDWAAAVYSTLPTGYASLGVKPCDDSSASQYRNNDKAGTPENYKSYVTAGARSGGGTNYVGSYVNGPNFVPTVLFANDQAMYDAAQGPNGTYGYGSNISESFGGFTGEKTPGYAITRVDAVLYGYVPAPLADNPIVSVSVGGQAGRTVTLDRHLFDTHVGAANAGPVYLDITSSRTWHWGDFDNNMVLNLDQTHLRSTALVYYDAVGLRVTSDLGSDVTGGRAPTNLPRGPINAGALGNVYNRAVRASDVWNAAPGYLQGQGVTVAVIDSGVFKTKDLDNRIIANVSFNGGSHGAVDTVGHGTFVAGIIAGDGAQSQSQRIGIAPKTNIVNVHAASDGNSTSESDVVASLQWVHDNRDQFNIRVVNMSLNASVAQSYMTSPIDAAVEILWFDNIVVVAAAGNTGTTTLFPPANDPFVITVGAADDRGTASLADDVVAPYSSYGTTESGFAKPDLVAPGTNIIGNLPDNDTLSISQQHPGNRVDHNYFRMSGTSMAAPMVSGAVALLLQDEPNLNPDQVKYRLKATAAKATAWPGYNATKAGAGYLDIYSAINGTTTQAANTGIEASRLLWTGDDPVDWSSVNWSSVNWSSVNWSSVNWSSVNWSSVNWSDYWAP